MTTKIPAELSSTPGIVDGSNSTAITIDSSERVGIGTASPASVLHIYDGGANTANTITFGNPSGTPKGEIHYTAGGSEFLTISAKGTNSTLGNIVFETGGTPDEKMRIAANGNVGIGNASPSATLDVAGRFTVSSNDGHSDTKISSTSNRDPRLYFLEGSTQRALIQSTSGTSQLLFSTGTTERMRIDSSGGFLVGKTANNQASTGFQVTGSNLNNVTSTNSGTGSSTYMVHDGSGLNFYVNFTGQVFYRVGLSNLSDQRLKENVVILDKGLDDILKIKPRRFDWIEGEGEKNQIGFIAQEVEEAGLEELVSHYKGASLDDAKGVNQAGLIPILVKAIQEQQAIIEDLQTQINEVKNGN